MFGAKNDEQMELLGSTQRTEYEVVNLPADAKTFKFQVQYIDKADGAHASEITTVEKPSVSN